MTQRFALGIQYDGRPWQGWQSQPGANTVQDQLEAALARFTTEAVRVIAAGRTDAGVHALGQVVHFECSAVRPEHGWIRGLNSLLPQSISVTWASSVPAAFHARFSAISRTYQYVLYLSPIRSPFVQGRAGWFYLDLDLEAMREAAGYLVGRHDFSALRSAQCQAKSPVKTIHRLDLERHGDFILVTVCADAFLHHMVRNAMGCLIAVGRKQYSAAWVASILEARERDKAAPTFMPDGLYLAAVEYPSEFALPKAPPLESVFPGLGRAP
ncbi:MAG: tRNA pseudouridine(38-40) synthase TruA [Burkholderiaceae bacterium]|jgi:tRNA pseudouridine38-40 synthase